jgi:phosphatidylglycerol---prolipoprotein diacylglyceryl transferase
MHSVGDLPHHRPASPVTVTRVTAASSVFLATIPSPDRGVWHLGPIPIRAYALCIIAGIILAIWWGERRWIARGGTSGTIVDIAVFAVPFGLVGGRLYHVATDWYRYFGPGKHPLDALRIWDGGLGIWGAIALGAVGAWIGCRVKGVPLPVFADAIAPGIVAAQGIGRIGNYFNQELYGGHTDLPWGLEIYRRVNDLGQDDNLNGVAVNHIAIEGSPVHPTFLYELIWNALVAVLVVWLDRKLRLGHGRAFAVYVMGYTLGRTWIELMRTDDATHVAGVRINVWVSILVFLGAAVYFVLARSRGEREDPALLLGKDAPRPDSGDAAGSDDAGDSDDKAKPDEDAKAKDVESDDAEDSDETAEDEESDKPAKADPKAADAKSSPAKETPGKPAAEKPAKPEAEKAEAEKPAAEKAETPATEKLATEKVATEIPAAEKPATGKAATKKADAKKPGGTKKADAEKPVAEKPAADTAAEKKADASAKSEG